MAESKDYVLQSNALSMQRLVQQHQLYKKSSQCLLLDAGLKPGLSVLELGCGPGLMTEWLCQQLDDTSTLMAIDISPDYVKAAQDRTASYNYCKVMVMNVHDIAHLQQRFDLIYARMLFHHLPNSAVLLQQAVDCLQPNGVVVFEENPAMEQVFSYPQLPALEEFIQLTEKTFSAIEANYKIAYTMSHLLRRKGLQIEIEQIFQPLLAGEERQLHLMGLRDISAKMVEQQLINKTQLAQLTNDLTQQLPQADVVTLYKLFQVVARKN